MSIDAYSYFDHEEFFSLDRETRGVKMITEQQRNNATVVSIFDEEGFLLRSTLYHRNQVRVEYRYEYSISDSLLEVKYHYRRTLNINPEEGYLVHKYYYNHLKQCYRTESYSSSGLSGSSKNFVYIDGNLQSYETHPNNVDFFCKFVYDYDGNQRTEQMYEVSGDLVSSDGCKSTSIYQNEKLIDYIRECNEGQVIVSGEILWNRMGNKVHIRYSNFDRRGNWTRSHFVTEKGKVFRSKRKIEYW